MPTFKKGLWQVRRSLQRQQKAAMKAAAEPECADVLTFVRTRLGFEPDEAQAEVLSSTAKRGILNCSRQWGKSTVAAAKAVHRAYSQAGKLVIVASPSQRQSEEFVKKATEMVRKLGLVPRGDGANKCSLQFPNGSRIVGLPGREGTVRGFSAVSLMLIDEASRVEDAMYRALRPMLAVGDGDLWLMSTPMGKNGFFWECWEYGGNEWLRVSVPATRCPRITAAFLERELRELGSAWFRQDYMCEFVDSGAGVFDRELLDRAVDSEVKRLEFGRKR